jgi:hypothetical protein
MLNIQQYFDEDAVRNSYRDVESSSQCEDELAVDVLVSMVHASDVPDLQRLSLACLQTRLYLLAMKLDSMHQKSGGRLLNLIASEEQIIRNISITDLNGLLTMGSPAPTSKKRKSVSFHDEGPHRFPLDKHLRRPHSGAAYDFLTHGSRVRIVRTGQQGTVVGEKSGGWRVVELVGPCGVLYGTYRPSDMAPVEQ